MSKNNEMLTSLLVSNQKDYKYWDGTAVLVNGQLKNNNKKVNDLEADARRGLKRPNIWNHRGSWNTFIIITMIMTTCKDNLARQVVVRCIRASVRGDPANSSEPPLPTLASWSSGLWQHLLTKILKDWFQARVICACWLFCLLKTCSIRGPSALELPDVIIEEVLTEISIPSTSFEHKSLYLQKHFSYSAAVCGNLWH